MKSPFFSSALSSLLSRAKFSVMVGIIAAALLIVGVGANVAKATVVGVYAGGGIYKGSLPNMSAALTGYNELIVWNIAVNSTGDLNFNYEFLMCTGGAYVGNSVHPDFPGNLAALKQTTTISRITFSIGSSNVGVFQSIRDLVNSQGTGPSSILYQNFQALKAAIPSVDAIDFDDENCFDQSSMVQFAVMLGKLGYKVNLAPYDNPGFWIAVASQVNSQLPGTIDRIHLQCYAGGGGNVPGGVWNFGAIPVYPGLWDANVSPSAMQTQMTAWKNQYNIGGGWLWIYDDMGSSTNGVFFSNLVPEQYAIAINSAISPVVFPTFPRDPGFESPAIGVNNFQYNPSGAAWTFSGASPNGSGIVANGSGFSNPNALEGSQAAFVQGLGTISQSISGFVPGQTYTITFSAAERSGWNESWNVKIDNTVIGSYNPGANATSYVDYTATFTATATTHTLSFVGTDLAANQDAVFIDNVRITSTFPSNSGFETPNIGAGNYQYNPAGGSWTFGGSPGNGSGIINNGSGFNNLNAPQGTQAAFVQGLGAFSQAISGFTPGSIYKITFSAAQRSGQFQPGSESWNVKMDSTVIGSYNPGAGATSYVDYTASFKATAATHTLSFVGTTASEASVFFDNVRITLVSMTFNQWEASYGVSTGPAATPFNDGVSNLLKYFCNVNPSRPMGTTDRTALPTPSIDNKTTSGTTYLALTYRQYTEELGVATAVQTSSDMKTWTTVVLDLNRQIGTDATTGDPIMEMGVKATGSKLFVRLNVTLL